jgi:hypothetical protein
MERLRIGFVCSLAWPSQGHLLQVLCNLPREDVSLVVGEGAKNASFVQEWATRKDVPVVVAPFNRELHGKSAVPRLTQAIITASEVLIAFQADDCERTERAIEQAKAAGKQVAVYTMVNGKLHREVFEPVGTGATA